MRCSFGVGVLLGMMLGLAPAAGATDGVREISQVCAEQTGCFAGDAPGLPVTIVDAGSYRLTGPLRAGSGLAAGDAVTIQAEGVFLDLNGFTISCRTLAGDTCASSGGSATGILARGADGLRISNGVIQDFAEDGVRVEMTTGFQLDALHLLRNRGDGLAAIAVSGGQIAGCQSIGNSAYGFDLPALAGSEIIVSDTLTTDNGTAGLNAPVTVRPVLWASSSLFFDGVAGTIGPLTCYAVLGIPVCPP